MYSRVNYTVVGIFVLLFGIGIIWLAFWLGKYDVNDAYYTYKLEINESISGLSVDSDVMLRGVDIGRVSDIRINPKNIELTEIFLLIRQDVPIKEDMVASTKMFGITGLLSIEIEGGTNAAKTLHPTDDYIPTIKSKASLMGTVGQKIERLSERLDILLSDKNLEKIDKILDHVEKITQKGETLELQTIQTLEEFRTSMKKVTAAFEGATQDFASTKKALIPTIKNFNRVIVKLERDLDKGDYNLKKILGPLITDMQIMTNQMTDLAREMEESPSDLIFKSRKQLKGPGE